MTKLTKIRYTIAFRIIDKFSHIIYRLREQHLVIFNDKIDKAAGYYWDKLEEEEVKKEIVELWYQDRIEVLPTSTD